MIQVIVMRNSSKLPTMDEQEERGIEEKEDISEPHHEEMIKYNNVK